MEFIPTYIVSYSNSDFTNPHEVVSPIDPPDCTSDYTHMGVKYWGLETKRHMAVQVDSNSKKIFYDYEAHNWLKLSFKTRAEISKVRISTKWFTGNQVQAVSLILFDKILDEEKEVLSRITLNPDQEHELEIPATTATEAYFKLFFEGGISRINFFGIPTEKQAPSKINLLEKATISHISNTHYGDPQKAINGRREEMHMVGWESARTGFGEQAIFHLEKPSLIKEIVVDTYLHRLNAPLSCHLFGLSLQNGESLEEYMNSIPKWMLQFEVGKSIIPEDFQYYMLNKSYLKEKTQNPKQFEILLFEQDDSPWKAILPFEVLRPDTYHQFISKDTETYFSHLLYMHFPNGGIHGLKVFG